MVSPSGLQHGGHTSYVALRASKNADGEAARPSEGFGPELSAPSSLPPRSLVPSKLQAYSRLKGMNNGGHRSLQAT